MFRKCSWEKHLQKGGKGHKFRQWGKSSFEAVPTESSGKGIILQTYPTLDKPLHFHIDLCLEVSLPWMKT